MEQYSSEFLYFAHAKILHFKVFLHAVTRAHAPPRLIVSRRQRLSLLCGLQGGQIIGIGSDQIKPLAQDNGPLFTRFTRPRWKRLLRSNKCRLCLLHTQVGHAADHRTVSQIADIKALDDTKPLAVE